MMLYVFYVDTGTMLTFDMSLAHETVAQLKQLIEKTYSIPYHLQVLLVSGGETLDEKTKVCSYSAGTDTNPIFLFAMSDVKPTIPPNIGGDPGVDYDFKTKVRESKLLPATYETVVQRAQLAQKFDECAILVTSICENLVHEQHLQQQGWAAVIANLDDIVVDFKKRPENAEKCFSEFLSERDNYLKCLNYFKDDLQILDKIPLISSLLESEISYDVSTEDEERNESETVSENADGEINAVTKKPGTLLEWISACDTRSRIDQLFEHCSRGLDQFDEKVLKGLQVDIEHAINASNKPTMKEIKGLGERLFGLEKLMLEAKRYVSEQSDLAQSFLQNQIRASNLRDTSILPDLCDSHRKQLQVMLTNHEQLCDIHRRCTKAKEELSDNLYQRLKWVIFVENSMAETNHKLMIYFNSLKRLRQHLEIIQQIHTAPIMYLSAVAEVVRRRKFSQSFLLWASEMACHMLTIHNEEVARRKDFQSSFEGHFLKALFPGMDDLPPNFATQAPPIFDSSLPKISNEDLDYLKEALPELAESLAIVDMSSIINFFLVKSTLKTDLDNVDVDDRDIEEKLVQVVQDVGLASNLDENLLKPVESETCLVVHGLAHLKDLDKGCESETDTEEFEKLCQSPLDLQFEKDLVSPRPGFQDASTFTEDNLQISNNERDKYKSLIAKIVLLSRQGFVQMRRELKEAKSAWESEKGALDVHISSLSSSWENLAVEIDCKEREIICRLSQEHQLEINDYNRILQCKTEDLKNMRDENEFVRGDLRRVSEENECIRAEMERLIGSHNEEIVELKCKLVAAEEARSREAKEVSERLMREHKAELDNMRKRFRLVTEMESNVERGDKSEASHETLMAQIKANFEEEKLKLVEEVKADEELRWRKVLEEQAEVLRTTFNAEAFHLVEDTRQKIIDEKEKLIEVLRERERNLNLECLKYKNTIQQMTEQEYEHNSRQLLEKLDLLEKDKCQLEAELCMERSRRFELPDINASVAVYDEAPKIDTATSPIKQHKEQLTKSQTSLIKAGKINIESCSIGDTVLVMWDSFYENFMILQDGKTLYFLHSECVKNLGLKKPSSEDKKTVYFTGEVKGKEYCHARKAENRYKVAQGTRFFRVKVEPSSKSTHKELLRSHPSFMTQSSSGGTQTELSADSTSHSLPSTPSKENYTSSSSHEAGG